MKNNRNKTEVHRSHKSHLIHGIVSITTVSLPLLGIPNLSFSSERMNREIAVLETVVVSETASQKTLEEKISTELAEYGHPVTVISGDDLKEAGFVDLQTALETLTPGYFSVARAGRGGYQFPSLHGSGSILWLVDGVRINNPLYSGGYPNTISIHIVERIEILKTGESLFYGSDATAGAINIITKKITNSDTKGAIGVSYGEKNYTEVFGHVSSLYNGHGFMAFGASEGWDGYVTSDDEAYVNALNNDKKHPTGYDRNTVGFKYRKEFDMVGTSSLNVHVQKQKGYFDYGYPHFKSTTFSDWEEELAIIQWEHELNDNFSYHIKSYLHTWWSEATFVRLDGSYWSDAALWGYDDYGANIMTSTRWGGGHEFIAGVDFHNYWGKDDFPGANFYGQTEQVLGVFANYRPHLFFSPKTKVSLGSRYTKTSGTNSTVWDVGIRTPFFKNFYIRGVANTSFTLPNIQQLYGTDVLSNRYGNPDLTPEKSLNTEIGLGGNWVCFKFDAAFFDRNIEDMIGVVSSTDGSSTYKNTEKETQVNGIALSAGIGPFNGWSLNTSATWVSAEEKNSEKQLSQIPTFYANANLQYRRQTGRFGADFMSRYIGDIYQRNLAGFDDVQYGDYFVFDLSAFMTIDKENRHKLTLRIENIFDEKYETKWYRARNADAVSYLYHYNGLPRNAVLGYTFIF
jgi:vitamin B12 transporter